MLRSLAAIFITILSVGIAVPTTMAQTPAQLAESDTAEAQSMFWEYVRLFQEKQYQEALNLLLSRKSAGDRWAKQALGDLFFDAPPEMAKLRDEWVNKAARQGDADAQFFLGYVLMHRALFDRLLSDEAQNELAAEAVEWLDKAADQGHKDAIFALSQLSRKKFQSRGIKSKHLGE